MQVRHLYDTIGLRCSVDKREEGRDDGPELTDEDELLLDLAWAKIAEEDRAAGRRTED